jgi:hypothetical protein
VPDDAIVVARPARHTGTPLAPPIRSADGRIHGRCAAQEVAMSRESLEARMDRLERRVDLLEQLPQRMDALEAQIVQLREEMRSEFSAIRGEIRDGDGETRRSLSKQMRDLFAANEAHMRVLHEDLVQRIATIKGG